MDYAAKLHSLQPYLSVFNIGLATLGLVHIVVGIILFFENLKARPTNYESLPKPRWTDDRIQHHAVHRRFDSGICHLPLA